MKLSTPLEDKIEANINEIKSIIEKIPHLRQKSTYFTFLAWIYIWETMKLIQYSLAGEVKKSFWIEKITSLQQEIHLENRRNLSLRRVGHKTFNSHTTA